MTASRSNHRGFTLVEILIVVIILGILAAIVVPQFTNASSSARLSSLSSMVQTARSQIQLYKLQHNDVVPDLTQATGWQPLTTCTTVSGTPGVVGTDFGPYLQSTPVNPFVATAIQTLVTTVAAGTTPVPDGATTAYYEDPSTGKIWGVATDPTNPQAWVLVGD